MPLTAPFAKPQGIPSRRVFKAAAAPPTLMGFVDFGHLLSEHERGAALGG